MSLSRKCCSFWTKSNCRLIRGNREAVHELLGGLISRQDNSGRRETHKTSEKTTIRITFDDGVILNWLKRTDAC